MKSIRREFRHPVRQRGQALIYGIFILFGALAATFYLFNTGQLSAEKTKLVNTADAVAYSAGVMHARALNFNAYTNRALIVNEATIAQMVSISSWIQYSKQHVQRVPAMMCYTYYAIPIVTATAEYIPLCFLLSYGGAAAVINAVDYGFNYVGPAAVAAAEVAKIRLQAAQVATFATMLVARNQVLRDVANANYKDNGAISVDTIPLTDNWSLFEGRPFISRRSGNDRTRFRNVEVAAINRDDFVRDRSWSSESPWPCIVLPVGRAAHTGGTSLQGFNRWQANDSAAFTIRKWRWRLTGSGCRQIASYSLGSGSRATTNSGIQWRYTGVPSFYDLSDQALAYRPENHDAAKRDNPRLQFAIRVTRDKGQQKTSAGQSEIKPSGRLNLYAGNQADNKMAAVSTSEVFFERPTPRADGRRELASLFNPYWQVHLVPNSGAVTAAALALQGAGN